MILDDQPAILVVLAVAGYFALKVWKFLNQPLPPGVPQYDPPGSSLLMSAFPVIVKSEVNKYEYEFLQKQWRERDAGLMSFCLRGYFRMPEIFVIHPDDAHYVLMQNLNNYRKGFEYAVLDPALGNNGLVNVRDPAYHKILRKCVSPAFRPAALQIVHRQTTVPLVGRFFDELVKEASGAAGRRLDGYNFAADIKQLTLGVVCEAAFKTDDPDIGVQFRVLQSTMFTNVLAALPFGTYIPTRTNRNMLAARGKLRAHAARIIAEERRKLAEFAAKGQKPPEPTSLLDVLVRPNEDDGSAGGCPVSFRSDEDIIDQCCTFLLAGHETTSATIEWVAHCLANHPADAEELFEEAESALAYDQVPSIDTLQHQMPLLNRFVKEVLRVYPPIPGVVRTAIETDTLPATGQTVPAGLTVVISPWFTQRLPMLWGDDADEFRPQRWDEPHSAVVERAKKIVAAGGRSLFLEQNERQKLQLPLDRDPTLSLEDRLPRVAWMPFMAGHRNCIGREFGLHEVLAVAAVMVRRFKWRRTPNQPETTRGYGTMMAPKPSISFDLELRTA